MNGAARRGDAGRDRRAAFESAVGLGLAVLALFTAPPWLLLVGVALVAFWYWFARGRRGLLAPATCLVLLTTGLVWRYVGADTASSTESILNEQTDRLSTQVAAIDKEIDRLQELQVATSQPRASDVFAPLRKAIINYMNDVRSARSVRPFEDAPELTGPADVRAQELAAKGGVPRGQDPSRLDGYRAVLGDRWQALGENGGSGATWSQVLDAMTLVEHADNTANIVNPDFNRTAVGLAFDATGQRLYVILVFVALT